MDPERYRRVKDLFAEARELPGARRSAFLDGSCAGDEELRREVEELLANDVESTGDALDRVLLDRVDDEAGSPPREQALPAEIGPYRILGVCGFGGMGTVYRAEHGSSGRRAALKVIQSGHLRPEILRRFRREAQILGRLRHPAIARMLEAGEFSQDGVMRPFIAMEYVEGGPLVDYARERGLEVDSRVVIFGRVCEAIQYAHEQGVVHRDLKPDNVFVVQSRVEGASADSSTDILPGQPKVLDFGVARLTDGDLGASMATGDGQLLGSVAYMSPEQASGAVERIDTRSDVYSLGVLLFELLTGELPHDVRGLSLSQAVASVRGTEPRRLGAVDASLGGDLEAILDRCLAKDPDRRFPSARALAEDLRRFRRRQPLGGRPDGQADSSTGATGLRAWLRSLRRR